MLRVAEISERIARLRAQLEISETLAEKRVEPPVENSIEPPRSSAAALKEELLRRKNKNV